MYNYIVNYQTIHNSLILLCGLQTETYFIYFFAKVITQFIRSWTDGSRRPPELCS